MITASIELLREVESILQSQTSYSEPIQQDGGLAKIVGLRLLRGEYALIIDSKAVMVDKTKTFWRH